MWDSTIDALQTVADHNPAIDIAIEYKPNEPRAYALMPDAATTLLAVREADRPNIGVTLDFAHVLYADEMPAHAAHLIARHSRLLGVHLNDGYGKRDDGLMVGTVHPIQTVELFVELAKTGYDGVIYFDTFPDQGGLDPVHEARTNLALVERLRQVAEGLIGRRRPCRRHRPAGCHRQHAHRRTSALRGAELDGCSRVFVAGSLHLDVILNAPRLPRLDETLMGSRVTYAFGGKGGNQALAAARMGAPTTMAGRVGDDAFGQQILDTLDASPIDRSQVLRRPGASGMSAAIVDANGNYGAVVVSAANQQINPGDIAMPSDTAILVLQNEIPEPVNLTLAEAAHRRGIPVLLNAAPARPMSDRTPALIRYLIVNRIEARDMTGTENPNAAAIALNQRGYRTVIVTLGADGLIHSTAGIPATPARLPSPTVISTHGAGDAFVGALAARLANGTPMNDALSFAQAAAALHVSTPVAQRADITPQMVTDFLGRQGTPTG